MMREDDRGVRITEVDVPPAHLLHRRLQLAERDELGAFLEQPNDRVDAPKHLSEHAVLEGEGEGGRHGLGQRVVPLKRRYHPPRTASTTNECAYLTAAFSFVQEPVCVNQRRLR